VAHIISPNINENNLNEQLISTNPILLICSKKYFEPLLKNNFLKNKIITFENLLELPSKNNSNHIESDDMASLIYTSGTTSKPKGVGIKHSNIMFTTKNIFDVLGYSNNDVEVVPLPMSHSFGLGCLHNALFAGSTIILHKNSMNLLDIIKSVKTHNATSLAIVPTTITRMIRDFNNQFIENCSNLRLIITNSTKVPEDTVKKILELNTILFATYYGLTEASRSTFMIFNDNIEKISSVGKAAPGVSIKIEKDSGSNDGIIFIKGKNVIDKYWKNLDADKQIMNDWLMTGDIGTIDSEGFLFLAGRTDDMINISGEKVMPQEIENTVKILSGVEDAAAIGIPHDDFGQLVKLFVVKSPNSDLGILDIKSHCKEHLERYKVPIKIEFIDELPKNEYGKIKRFMLK